MSQTMRIPTINDSFWGEILTYFPDEDEAKTMVEEALTDGWLSENRGYNGVVRNRRGRKQYRLFLF